MKRNKRKTDGVSFISSGRSCISTSSNVARALRMRIPKRNPKNDDAFLNQPDLTQILHFGPPLPIAAPPTQPDIAGPSAPQLTPSTIQLTPILRKEKRTVTVSETSESDSSSVRWSKRHLRKQKKSPNLSSLVESIQNTEGYSDVPTCQILIRISLEMYYQETRSQWSVDPKPNLPREMTVLEERSDSE